MYTDLRVLLDRLLRDETGQDQVEYALLTVVVGLLGAASADLIRGAISYVYGSWISGTNNLWEPPNPS